jgi:glutamate N-acetyltransferase/amino-acid N-acetyltransferase
MFTILPIKGYIDQIDGFFCDGIHAGLKPNGNNDLGFIYTKEACTVAAIFTENRFQAAPLKHFLAYEEGFKTNFVLINSKNANALTGRKGIEDINTLFSKLNFDLINPVMSSTGVIGNRLPIEKLVTGALKFDLTAKSGENLSRAIMTTDAYPKTCLYEVKLEDGSSFKIGAVAKGAGMINPNLATMLCFICTDADVPYKDIKEALNKNKETTFNAISVDGDTSTNDTVMVLANGKSNAYNKDAFCEALRLVMHDMATNGLLGEKYLKIVPGGGLNYVKRGESIGNTQGTMDLEDLISKFITGGAGKSKDASATTEQPETAETADANVSFVE